MASHSRQDGELEKEVRNGALDSQETAADDSQLSDNDGGERPVRNKLKETSITSAPAGSTDTKSVDEVQDGESSRESSRGRKRSFDEEQPGKNEDELGHRRKRSRDSSTEDTPMKTDDAQLGNVLGLKKKRSRDQLDKDNAKAEDVATKSGSKAVSESGALDEKSAAEGQPEKKRHRDDSQERDAAPVPSAFANTSSVSPFGSLGTATTTESQSDAKPTTSSSAFAASSLAAFSGSEQSPFGSLGGSTASVFKSSATSTSTETEKPASTGFAGASKPSGFAALGSGFSGFSGGFGAGSSGGGLTSFASPSGASLLGSSSSKAFGAAEDDSDGEDNKEDVEEAGPAEFAEDKTDERFFERPLETGEEEEKTYFSCKAKMFQFSDKEWKERGVGTFKVNIKVTDGVEDKKMARMIMRADGVLRVMLNTPLFKGMKVGDPSGNEPKSKQIHLACLENNRTVPVLLRTGSEDHAKELYRVLQDLLQEL